MDAEELLKSVIKGFVPPQRLTVSEWADRYRKLSAESSAEPGQWRTDRAEYQRGMMDAVSDPSTDMIVIMSSSQVGKALDINTKIVTPSGWTNLREIKVGDKVFDEQGKPTTVIAVSPIMYDRPCWRITFSDRSQLLADSNHHWTVDSDRCGQFKGKITISTEDVAKTYKKGDRNVYAIAVAKPLQIPSRKLPIDPYVLGAWLGDGHSHAGCLSLFTKDSLEIIKQIESVGHQFVVTERPNNSVNVLIDPRQANTDICLRGHVLADVGLNSVGRCRKCATQIASWNQYHKKKPDPVLPKPLTFRARLDNLGLISKKEKKIDKFIPSFYLRASFEQRLALLQGLMDTDGYIGSDGRSEFTTVSPILAVGFGELLSTLGIKYGISVKVPTLTYKGKKVTARTAYRFSFLVYSDLPIFRLSRKLNRMVGKEDGRRRVSETVRRRIIEVVPIHSVPVRCIQVDSDSHLYLAGETLIPTHNSELVNNAIAYYIALDPGPILLIQPTVETAEDYSKDRIAPMIRDTPVLAGLVSDVKSKGSGNTILHKKFPGGQLVMGGANSPAGLASRPIRVILADEVDRYPASAGSEGDPVDLAVKRTTTFWNKKIILVSTPTIKGASRIEKAYNSSDQRRYYVSCPHCQHPQTLVWSQVKWDKGSEKQAWYECERCHEKITNSHKQQLIRAGFWQPTEEFNGIAGFHINELYSPWRTFGDVVESFLTAKNDSERLMVWVNTSLGETFDREGGEGLEWQQLAARAEPYKVCTVPKGGKILTAGVDVQGDRLSLAIWAWGRGEEAWLVFTIELYGDPTESAVWEELDAVLLADYSDLKISAVCIDSGFKPQEVYNFIRHRPGRKIMAIKGMSTPGKPIIGKPTPQEITYKGKNYLKGIKLYPVGSDTAKSLIYGRLRLKNKGEGFIHTYLGLDDEFYEQLCAEKLVTKYVKGYPKLEWVKTRTRNESLDCLVYSYAAAIALGMARINWDKFD